MDEWLPMLAGAIGMVAYAVVAIGLLKSDVQQSFAAFLLWSMLDFIATVTTLWQGGNYWLPLANASGSLMITLLLLAKKQAHWSYIETLTSMLVAACLAIWWLAGERSGIVASSLAVVIASIPQMADTYRNPGATPLAAYLIFLASNVVSLLGGKAWTIEERFYAACSVFLCLIIIIFAMRKRTTRVYA